MRRLGLTGFKAHPPKQRSLSREPFAAETFFHDHANPKTAVPCACTVLNFSIDDTPTCTDFNYSTENDR
jgi:hypothetical protein